VSERAIHEQGKAIFEGLGSYIYIYIERERERERERETRNKRSQARDIPVNRPSTAATFGAR